VPPAASRWPEPADAVGPEPLQPAVALSLPLRAGLGAGHRGEW
jgi:hypothetical protein